MSVVGQGDEPDPRGREGVRRTICCYEIEGGLVMYDEDNPATYIQVEGEKGAAYVDVGPQ